MGFQNTAVISGSECPEMFVMTGRCVLASKKHGTGRVSKGMKT
jgi:hypothetical protein